MRREEPEGYAPAVTNPDPRPQSLPMCSCGALIPPWRHRCIACELRGSAARIKRLGFDPFAEDE
jgi:hypothetical protein